MAVFRVEKTKDFIALVGATLIPLLSGLFS